MRDLLKPTEAYLQQFVEQHDKLALIFRSPASDALAILKVIEGLEDPNPSDFFWIFNDPFVDATSYASSLVKGFASKHGMVQVLQDQEQMDRWPDMPAAVLSEGTPPMSRIRELAAYSRELLPVPLGGNNVWVFYPLHIADHIGYATFVQGVLEHEFPNPWCHHLRFMAREDPEAPLLSQALGAAPSVDFHEPDLSPQAVERSLEREVEDDSQPIEVRLNSLLVLAATDMAHGRFERSLERHAQILKYHAAVGNHTMAAVALNGMGEVYERMEDHDRANQAFQAALIPASHGEHPPWQVFQNVSMNLANLRMKQGNFEQSGEYWDVVQKVSTVTRNPDLKLRALDQMGYCLYRSQKVEDAERIWRDGATLALKLENKDLGATLLERRRALYVELGQTAKEQEVSQQLSALKS
ncbi:tetratricopeptide repeat protein [Aureliella helgolandensis]|uniref:Tetratricopeptide repeat protein n=1 Tax=Aureliella helgolandensis TaxID=2527968 RepID=A0A518GCU5_9BACT|nr:tetratricopeptide repeat protein [Aureliella helgolandensis]QDV26398.1 Tetratricopeptide repeat protein [Aureliella helgolandensis]